MAAANDAITQDLIPDLGDDLKSRSASGAAAKLKTAPGGPIAATLSRLNPGFAQDVLEALPAEARERAFSAASAELARQWKRNGAHPKETIGRIANLVEARSYGPLFSFHTIDIRLEELRTVFERHRPEVVMHMAAQATGVLTTSSMPRWSAVCLYQPCFWWGSRYALPGPWHVSQ